MANPIIIPASNRTLSTLVRIYNLQNIRVPDVRDNNYQAGTVQSGYTQPDPTRASKLYPQNKGGYLGIPVFADVTLQGGFYTDEVTGNRVDYPEIRLECVLVTAAFTARIVKTEIQGRAGTVKEYIGEDDAKITIQGVITGPNGVYPQNEVNALNQWRRAPVTKGVVCGFLQNLGVSNLVVEDCTLPQIAGGYSYQTYIINCISDLPVELLIKSNGLT